MSMDVNELREVLIWPSSMPPKLNPTVHMDCHSGRPGIGFMKKIHFRSA